MKKSVRTARGGAPSRCTRGDGVLLFNPVADGPSPQIVVHSPHCFAVTEAEDEEEGQRKPTPTQSNVVSIDDCAYDRRF